MANQEQAATSTMKDKLQKPQSELKLLQEHMKKEMAQWDHERSSFNHLRKDLGSCEGYGEKQGVDKEDGHTCLDTGTSSREVRTVLGNPKDRRRTPCKEASQRYYGRRE
ncbi:hypothetical protein V6N13_008162 [Hibiscus sabdariffa]